MKNQFLILENTELLKKLSSVEDAIQKLDEKVSNLSGSKMLDNSIPEKEAQKLLGKGTTWFWQQRQSGRLNAKKLGGTNYYDLSELQNLIKD